MDGLETQLFMMYCATCTFMCYVLLRMEEGWLSLLAVLAYGAVFAAPMAHFLWRDIRQDGGQHLAWGVVQASVAMVFVVVMTLRLWNDRRARQARRRRCQRAAPSPTGLLVQKACSEGGRCYAGVWSQMPEALMGQVLQSLDRSDLRSVRLTCGEWFVSSGHNVSHLRPSKFLPSKIVEIFPSLEELDLRKCTDEVEMEGLRHLQELKNLKVLDMGKDPKFVAWAIDDRCIEELLSLRILHTLNLAQCVHVTNEGLGLLAGLSSLTSLSISGCVAVTDAGVAQLSCLARLLHLEVSWCLKISDAGIAALSAIRGLEEINLSGCQLISEAGVAGLSIFTALRCLNLLYTGVARASVSDTALAALSDLVHLRQLTIGGVQLRGTRVSDEGLKTIAKNHRALTHLSLMWLNIGNEGVFALTDLSHLEVLVLRGCTRVTSDAVRHLAVLPALRDVNLLGNPWLDVTDGVVGAFRPLTGLRSLGLGDAHSDSLLTDTGMEALAEFEALTSLSLEYTRWEFAGDGLSPLLHLASLRCLDLQGCGSVNDATLRTLGKLSGITSLQLARCEKVTSRGVAQLGGLTRLEALSLGRCHQVDDVALAALAPLCQISTLTLSGCSEVTDRGLSSLASLSGLQSLDVSGCERVWGGGFGALGHLPLTILDLGSCVGLTDEGLVVMGSALEPRTLMRLNMCHCGLVTDCGLEALRSLTSLTGLDLAYCSRVGDATLRMLSHLPRLTTLKFNGCINLTDAGVAMLTRLERLLTVHLDRCQGITDKGLCSLSKCSTLTSLRLHRCTGITDDGILFLSSLTRLCILNLASCPKVTEVGLAALRHLGLACREY